MRNTVLLLSLLLGGFALQVCLADYEPQLPKTSPTKKILVIDLAADKANGGGSFYTEAQDALAAAICLQGLVNRNSETKVFFNNVPVRFFWDLNRGGQGNPYDYMIEDGLLPFQIERVTLDATKQYPALSYMMSQYADLLSGKVLCPSADGKEDHTIAGARMAALTACTFEDALLVSPGIDAYLQSEGYELKAIADTRGMSNIEATRWSLDKYMDLPKRTKQYVAFNDNVCEDGPAMYDYWIATYAYSFFLDHRTESERAVFEEVLNEDNYAEGTPMIGGVEARFGLTSASRLGYPSIYGHVPNASVTASIPTDPSQFRPAPEPKAHPIDPKGVYIAWLGPDGDAIDWLPTVMYKNMRNDPAIQHVPLGYRVNPVIMDLFPTLFEWFTKQYPENMELVMIYNDGGMPGTEAGQLAWGRSIQHYVANSAGAYTSYNLFGSSAQWTELFGNVLKEPSGIQFVPRGYHGGKGENDPQFEIKDGVVFAKLVGWRGYSDNELFAELAQSIKQGKQSEQPFFLMAKMNDECGVNTFTKTEEVMDILLRHGPFLKGDYNFYFMTPRDLAATYKQWKESI